MSIEAILERMANAAEAQTRVLEDILVLLAAKPVAEETKPASRKAPVKDKTPPAPEPEVEAEVEPEADPLADDIEEDPLAETEETLAAPTYTEDEVRAALVNFRTINGSEAVTAVLAAHGAKGMATLKPDTYASVMKAVR